MSQVDGCQSLKYFLSCRKFAKPCPRGLWGLNSEKCMGAGKRRNTTRSQGRKIFKIKCLLAVEMLHHPIIQFLGFRSSDHQIIFNDLITEAVIYMKMTSCLSKCRTGVSERTVPNEVSPRHNAIPDSTQMNIVSQCIPLSEKNCLKYDLYTTIPFLLQKII